ncbi:MAG TPA: HEAT repeat domain-containing protein [Polyangiaceae bacterium]|jgi:hypothetical protein
MIRPLSRSPLSSRRGRAACVVLALVAGGALSYRAFGPKVAAVVAPDAPPLALHFEPGTTLHYQLAWSGEQRGRIFQGDTSATQPGEDTHATTRIDMALRATFFVEAVKKDEALLVMTITDVDRYGFHILGGEVFPSHEGAAKALIGHRARVRVAASGEALDVAFERDAPDVFMNVVQWIVARSAISLGGSGGGVRSWDAYERGPFGLSAVRYARLDDGGVGRARTRYTSFDAFAGGADPRAFEEPTLDGHTTAHLQAGVLQDLEEDERVKVVSHAGEPELEGGASFHMLLTQVDRAGAAPAAVAYGAPSPAGTPIVGRETRAQLLDQRIDGLTPEQLLADVRTYANGGVMPQHTRWLWRASGLLKRDPSLAAELAKTATAKGATDTARALVLDLLASVGDASAQAAMREILDSSALASSGARPGLLQRVSFLDAPDEKTIDSVVAAMRAGKQKGWSDLRFAAAHAVAAASRAVAKNGDDATARQLVRRLDDEVRTAETPQAKAALLGALANASIPEAAAVAAPFASSDDADLREAAAEAVKRTDTADAKEMLFALLGDPDPSVEAAAIASLAARSLDATDWQRIASVVETGRVVAGLDGPLLNLASSYAGLSPSVAEVIAFVGARAGTPELRARAQAMLARAGRG